MKKATSAQHRQLRFANIDECLAEIDRVVAAARAGKLQATGTWTAGQILSHLAAWIEYGYNGYPLKSPPAPVRWLLRTRLRKTLDRGMRRGVRIPRIPGGTVGQDEMETEAAANRLKAALERLKRGEEARYDSPAFGKMSHDDRIRLNLRHAELHLGFLRYGALSSPSAE
jgi:hypothetical protein